VELPPPGTIIQGGRRRVKTITGGGGIPLYTARARRLAVPNSLDEAKRFLARLPPLPPGRTPVDLAMAKKIRRCHGCHGLNDESHVTIPLGADRCPRPHDSSCAGGIIGGKDNKGRDWRACPLGYFGPAERTGPDSETEDSSGEEWTPPSDEDFKIASPPPMLSSQPITTTSHTATSSMSSLGSTTTVSSAPSVTISSTSHTTSLTDELAALEKLKLERTMLEDQVKLMQQQKLSAERLEVQRQLAAEQARIEQLRQASMVQPELLSETQAGFMSNMQQQQQLNSGQPLQTEFRSAYKGPNIKVIRKTKGLRNRVEETVETVRSDIPSLGHRP
jgi:hypothetical protein